MSFFKTVLFLVVVWGGIGCSTWNKLDNTEKGAIIGGASGAAVGNAVGGRGAGGTLLGGAAGAVGGGLIGREIDKNDRRRYR
jgi:outer membrane lipoprotein SlyB